MFANDETLKNTKRILLLFGAPGRFLYRTGSAATAADGSAAAAAGAAFSGLNDMSKCQNDAGKDDK